MSIIQTSQRCPRYFELENGETFLPVGGNFCFVRDTGHKSEEEVLQTFRRWMQEFARYGGNFARIWLGVPFFNLMPDRMGVISETALDHIRTITGYAEEFGIKLKFTLEHFRYLAERPENMTFKGIPSFAAPLYLEKSPDIQGYLNSPECRACYLKKADVLAQAVGDSPAVAFIELWNEINSLGCPEAWMPWSAYMMPELARRFPRQQIVQNIGSFCSPRHHELYSYLARLSGNAYLQAHRYFDPGAQFPVCREEMDILAADTIRELLRRNCTTPCVLAEVGAVEACHRSFSHYYELDKEGLLLHDEIFAPFFAGSAGCGQPWHWDHLYIDRHHLLYHFGRFARAVAGIDPAAEAFYPEYSETADLRIYILRGRMHSLYYCRDKQAEVLRELDGGEPARTAHGLKLEYLPLNAYEFYDPWQDVSGRGQGPGLPDFRRSIVLRETLS